MRPHKLQGLRCCHCSRLPSAALMDDLEIRAVGSSGFGSADFMDPAAKCDLFPTLVNARSGEVRLLQCAMVTRARYNGRHADERTRIIQKTSRANGTNCGRKKLLGT